MKKKTIIWSTLIILLIACSFIFAGKRTNPPVETNITWESEQAKDLFYKACADCHSHETKWPWYSNVAPISWLLIHHVEDGRSEFNISTEDMGEAEEAYEMVEEKLMPLTSYTWMHAEANLSPEQREILAKSLKKMFAKGEKEQADDGHDHEHHQHDH